MEAGQVAIGDPAATRTLCMDLLWITESAATVNGSGCAATPKVVGSEGMILAKIGKNPGLRFLGFLTDEAEAMVKERPRWVRILYMDPREMPEGPWGCVFASLGCHVP